MVPTPFNPINIIKSHKYHSRQCLIIISERTKTIFFGSTYIAVVYGIQRDARQSVIRTRK